MRDMTSALTRDGVHPETRLLLNLARDDQPIGPICPDIDVREFLRLASRHQVSALSHHQLRSRSLRRHEGDLEALPQVLRDALRQDFIYHSLRNKLLVRDIERIEVQLRRARIESVYFKGPWLAFRGYPDPGTRPVQDIDLGVHEKDYAAVVEILLNLGYEPDASLPSDGEEALRRAHYGSQIRFQALGRRLVELHFRLVNFGAPMDAEGWLWHGRRELTLYRETIRVPGNEAMLLHLLLHANQHGFSALRLFYDVRFALASFAEELDSARFVEIAQSLRCAPAIYRALTLSQELVGARVPSSLLQALQPGLLRLGWFDRLWDIDRVRRLEGPMRRQEFEGPRLALLELGRLPDKIRYLRGIVREAGGVLGTLRKVQNTGNGRRASGWGSQAR